MTAGDFQLLPLVRDLPEEACVLNRQCGLGGEGLQQRDDFRRELAGAVPVHDEAAGEAVLAKQGHGQHGPRSRAEQPFAEPTVVGTRGGDVWHLNGSPREHHAAGNALAPSEPDPAPQLDVLVVEVVRGAKDELLGRLIVLINGATVGARELDSPGHDGRQHSLQVQRRANCLPDLSQRLQLPNRSRQLQSPRLELRKQPHVLDRDHRLLGEGLEQLDLLVRERPRLGPSDSDRSHRLALAQHRDHQQASEAHGHQVALERVGRILKHIRDLRDGASLDCPAHG